MAPIISARGLAKRFGVAPLFRSISFTVSEGERIGIIGPNGSGKSTLLAILQGRVVPDSGDVAVRKGIRLGSVLQMSDFGEGETVRSLIVRSDLKPEKVSVELNRRLLRSERYDTPLKDGDEVEIVTFVGGG